jgi:L-lactate dehydrogenase complex protein LldG
MLKNPYLQKIQTKYINQEDARMKKVCENWQQLLPQGKSGVHLFDEFELRAENVSAEVLRVNDARKAGEELVNLAKSAGAKKIVAVGCPLMKESGVVEALRASGIEVYTETADIRTQAETADMGISGVEFGVAETGSTCQDAYSIESRLVSTLPPVHVVFLNSENIVPGIEDALDVISKTFDHGYVSLITGPSRTADIERVLTIGVHGPSRYVIIAVDGQLAKGVA